MNDPIMSKGSAQSAVIPITVRPAGLTCEVELWLTKDSGASKATTSGLIPFTATGAPQQVSCPIVMPLVWGSHEVYIDVYTDGVLIGAYIATEQVTLPDVTIEEPVWD